MTESAATQISLTPLFEAAFSKMRHFLTSASYYRADLLVTGPDNMPEPRWNQDLFPRRQSADTVNLHRSAAPGHAFGLGRLDEAIARFAVIVVWESDARRYSICGF